LTPTIGIMRSRPASCQDHVPWESLCPVIASNESRRIGGSIPISENHILIVCDFQPHPNVGPSLISYCPQHWVPPRQIQRHEIVTGNTRNVKVSTSLHRFACDRCMRQPPVTNHVVWKYAVA